MCILLLVFVTYEDDKIQCVHQHKSQKVFIANEW